MTAYENFGLSKKDVLGIQHFLFPIIDKYDSISEMILTISMNYKVGSAFYVYAIYLLGWHVGAARIEESLGITHVLNPDDI